MLTRDQRIPLPPPVRLKLPDGRITELVAVYDGGKLTWFINGKPIAAEIGSALFRRVMGEDRMRRITLSREEILALTGDDLDKAISEHVIDRASGSRYGGVMGYWMPEGRYADNPAAMNDLEHQLSRRLRGAMACYLQELAGVVLGQHAPLTLGIQDVAILWSATGEQRCRAALLAVRKYCQSDDDGGFLVPNYLAGELNAVDSGVTIFGEAQRFTVTAFTLSPAAEAAVKVVAAGRSEETPTFQRCKAAMADPWRHVFNVNGTLMTVVTQGNDKDKAKEGLVMQCQQRWGLGALLPLNNNECYRWQLTPELVRAAAKRIVEEDDREKAAAGCVGGATATGGPIDVADIQEVRWEVTAYSPPTVAAAPLPSPSACECGADAAGTTHAAWCPKAG